MDVSYPPQPWDLHGSLTAGVLLVPVAELPAPPPPGTRLVTVAGRAVVAAAFFRYTEPSPLQYGEVMATVLVRQGWRLRVHILQIWVDSEASLRGGRELWAIPKDLAVFQGDPGTSMSAEGIASLHVRRARGLPGRWPTAFRTAQSRGTDTVVTPVSGRVKLSLVRGDWTFEGPLAWLCGRRVLLSAHARRFTLRFGRA